jgi:hypothetical protein
VTTHWITALGRPAGRLSDTTACRPGEQTFANDRIELLGSHGNGQAVPGRYGSPRTPAIHFQGAFKIGGQGQSGRCAVLQEIVPFSLFVVDPRFDNLESRAIVCCAVAWMFSNASCQYTRCPSASEHGRVRSHFRNMAPAGRGLRHQVAEPRTANDRPSRFVMVDLPWCRLDGAQSVCTLLDLVLIGRAPGDCWDKSTAPTACSCAD